jgi:serine/threonine protein kinase, bacterial
MPLGEGRKFAGFTIVRQLGAGGMGEVYLAQHPRLPRNDALKLLGRNVSADPSFHERFLREADLASRLWHPHIVGVHDRGEHRGQLWISMDFVDGADADSLMAQRYPAGMPQDLVAEIVTAVASALDYAHKQGLLHRDVKPANILLTNIDDKGERRILLTDFGIARTVDEVSGLTATNTTLGTVAYTSPEQLMGEDLDGRADQYSLAASAYHLLTGTPVFGGSSPAVVSSHHLNTEPPALADARSDLAALDAPLAAALAKDPNDRFATCSDFARAFAEQVSGNTGGPVPAAPTTPAPVKPAAAAPPAAPGSMRPQPPSPLAPGWYPDPSGKPGTLYWDGRGWRTAEMPVAAAGAARPKGGGVHPALWVAVLAVAIGAAIIATMVFIRTQDDGSDAPSADPTRVTASPTYTDDQEPTTGTTPPTSASPTAAPSPPTTSPTPEGYWSAMIVGTCDEGGSCGVQQRTAPYSDAPRLYPNDLQDLTTVRLMCQTIGDLRTSGGQSSFVWYQLYNGAYVSSVYMDPQPVGIPAC